MKKVFIVVLALLLIGALIGYTERKNTTSGEVSISDNKSIKTVEGVVKEVEQGIDGISAIIQSNDKEYRITISVVTTEILGDLEKIQKGTKIKVTGELWGEPQLNMTARSVQVLDTKLDYVINLRSTVKSIEPGKDGISVEIITEDGTTFSSTISMVTTEIPVGKMEDIKENTKLWISGDVIELEDKFHIVANTALVYPQEITSEKNLSQIYDEYETVGEIIDFEEDGVHIITGDVVDIFKVDKESIKNFYLGETVGVKKIDEDKFELEKYKINDFNVRYTNMGELISTASGKIKEVSNSKFILSTIDGDIEFKAYDELLFEKGTEVTVDYIKFGPTSKGKILIDIYDEDSKISLIVKSINRSENGMMVLGTEDENGLKYDVYVLGKSVLNFNHSDLKVNDKITVYPEVIRESYPAQVDAKIIKKQ